MKPQEGRLRAVVTNIHPQVDNGRFAIKRVIGDQVIVSADVFTDGHSQVTANLLFRHEEENEWRETPMQFLDNDRWTGQFTVDVLGVYFYKIQAWVDYFLSWQKDLEKKFKANRDVSLEIQMGLDLIKESLQLRGDSELEQWYHAIEGARNIHQAVTLSMDKSLYALMRERYPNKNWVTENSTIYPVTVDTPKAVFSTWYELFPRSTSPDPNRHGTFKDCQELLPELADMGFDVLYLPPIHPIGRSKRRGRNNQAQAAETDVGSPWAIGAHEGGHKSIHPDLGTLEDFEDLVKAAKEFEIDIALDLAYQCSLDHPYLQEHPEWFRWRPDRSIQYAENPPKKYEDIVPFYFENDNWKELWEELRSIVFYWIEKGVRIFRVDNPHTKPFPFWEWLIYTVKQKYPDIIFLAEAFTRPKVMYQLAKLGFTQSYTYFTWRHTKRELTDYLNEITSNDLSQYFRPNLWTNTPDILTEELQRGGKPAFFIRLVLAATLGSNYGMYGPAFQYLIHEAVPGTEEYMNSEKYERHCWQHESGEHIKDFIKLVNTIRKANPALQKTTNLKFYEIDNDQILYYGKINNDPDNKILIVVNLDPFNTQSGVMQIPIKELGLSTKSSYQVHELLTGRFLTWGGDSQRITLDPLQMPACIFKIQRLLRREVDFEYFL